MIVQFERTSPPIGFFLGISSTPSSISTLSSWLNLLQNVSLGNCKKICTTHPERAHFSCGLAKQKVVLKTSEKKTEKRFNVKAGLKSYMLFVNGFGEQWDDNGGNENDNEQNASEV